MSCLGEQSRICWALGLEHTLVQEMAAAGAQHSNLAMHCRGTEDLHKSLEAHGQELCSQYQAAELE